MLIDILELEESSLAMPWAKKASIFLMYSEKACLFFDDYPNTQRVCREAILACWGVLSNENIDPVVLSSFVDGNEGVNPYLQESIFLEGSNQKNALIYIVMVLGYFANYLYKLKEREDEMSENACEANDDILCYLIEWIKKLHID